MNLRTVTIVLCLGLVASGCSSAGPSRDGGTDAGADAGRVATATTGTVARGQYLVDHVLVCGTCHTPTGTNGKPDLTKYLAGSRNYDFTDSAGVKHSAGDRSDDTALLNIWPLGLIATWRLDALADQYRWFPLIPYAQAGLTALRAATAHVSREQPDMAA